MSASKERREVGKLGDDEEFEVEEKPFTSSLNIFPEACCGKGWVQAG
jgi:hypothetical protein